MSASNFPTSQYTSTHFTESAGAILFRLTSTPNQVSLIRHPTRDEWSLPKGRRNCQESRKEAAVREVMEETGYPCRIYPVTMATRSPMSWEPGDVEDKPRMYPGLEEPFMLTMRELDGGSRVKLIWWYVAVVDDNRRARQGEFETRFWPFREALQKLTFEDDRKVLAQAIEVLESREMTEICFL
ncbi:NUDIX hydrolase domain-like protein [Aspergillus bertholletiae]|uniref:NUDIX hydrolase domain-like protein n=1 Tax=Aspergillus bertholletiae TaxID=1226010 RepID=A0A5N7BJP0_9EURO|nr:NUDIX hydrolase domain-like protein [Aspergillus bertholletiae]